MRCAGAAASAARAPTQTSAIENASSLPPSVRTRLPSGASATRAGGAEPRRAQAARPAHGSHDVDELLADMTLAEKIGQMTQLEIGDWVGVSQMQISRIIRQSLVRLRMDIERERSTKVA